MAQLAPPHTRTPPAAYRASELVASLITEELVRRGHDVTLFASPDSLTTGCLVSFPEAVQFGTFDYRALVHVGRALSWQGDFDIVHNHCLFAGAALAGVRNAPVLSTLHYIHPIAGFAEHDCVAVSFSQRAEAAHLNVVAVVHNGIDAQAYTFQKGQRRLPAVSGPPPPQQKCASGDRRCRPLRVAAGHRRAGAPDR